MTINLTGSQAHAFDLIAAFLQGPDRVFILQGYAGTGKTFQLGQLAHWLAAEKRSTSLLAPTGRAARVITRKTNLPASTIHSKIYTLAGLEFTEGSETEAPSPFWLFRVRPNEDSSNTVYIVDESSMVSDTSDNHDYLQFGSGRLLSDLLEFAGIQSAILDPGSQRKIIFVGDPAQLPPVNSPVSPALTPAYWQHEFGLTPRSYCLTEVVRQKEGSGVLRNATNIRNAIEARTFNRFVIEQDENVTHVNEKFLEYWQTLIDSGSYRDAIAVTYSNAAAVEINRAMRLRLFRSHQETVVPRDHLLVTSNNFLYHLMNGDIGEVVSIDPNAEVRTVPLKGVKDPVRLGFHTVKVRFETNDDSDSVLECRFMDDLLWKADASISREVLVALRVNFEQRTELKYPSRKLLASDRREYIRQRENYQSALSLDPYVNALHVKFGFAVTCHKAQGGEWEHVFVDFRGIGGIANEPFFRWAYTATTRSRKSLYTIHAPRLLPWTAVTGGIDADHLPVVPEPTPQGAPSPDVTADTNPIAPGGMALVDQIRELVRSKIKSTDIFIDDVSSLQYAERFFFSRGSESVRIDFSYKKNGSVTVRHVGSVGGPLAEELAALFGQFTKIHPQGEGDGKSSSPQPFLSDWHKCLEETLSGTGINVAAIEHRDYCERYHFDRNEEFAVVDFHYSASGLFTARTVVPHKRFSNELAGAIAELIDSIR